MGLTAFDLVAGAVLLISGLIGFSRGATREVTGAIAFVLALLLALACSRLTTPLMQHVFAAPWLAHWAGVLFAFLLIYVLLRMGCGVLVRGVRQTGPSGLDLALGAGVGLARGLVVVGLAMLLVDWVAPSTRAPGWIASARLYPLAEASGAVLRAAAPAGERFAGAALREPGAEAPRSDEPVRRGLAVVVDRAG